MTDREFALFQALIEEESGIHLGPAKKALLVGRLARRLRELGLSYRDYHRLVRGSEEERVRMLDLVATNETRFFREPAHFRFLDERVFPAWKAAAEAGARPRRARVWSAACSTGEEPYSLAMLLREHFPAEDGWDCQVLATDLSTRALDRARAAVWPEERAAAIPDAFLRRHMLRGEGPRAGRVRVAPEVRSLVSFARLNLNDDEYPVRGPFDLVLCRNALIYFGAERKARVVDRLLDRLAPDGYLFVGHAESLTGMTSRVRAVIPTVYAQPA